MPVPPTPIDTSSGIPMSIQTLEYYEGKKEQAFGRFKNSSGDTTTQAKTATESKIIMAGQNALDAYENDIIGNDFIVPTFEKLGEFMANFQDKDHEIRYKDSTGKEAVGVVDDTVRQGDYVYMIGDSQTSVEKKANQEQTMLSAEKITPFLTAQGKRWKVEKVINMWGAINDIEAPTEFIEDVPPPPPTPTPEPNEIIANLARYTIQKLQMPDEDKILFMQEIGLMPKMEEQIESPTGTGSPADVPFVQDAGMAGGMPPLPNENIQ
jgi:hypothetical protein